MTLYIESQGINPEKTADNLSIQKDSKKSDLVGLTKEE
jgi:hypothetical protein